jgi:glycosyltransferase involved in cell wall biosynthesis
VGYQEEFVIKGRWLPEKIGNLLKELVRPFVRYALRRATVIAAVSTYSEKRAQAFTSVPTVIIPNGVDTEKFVPDPHKEKKWTICTTSTLIPRNGLDVLIKSFYRLAQKHDNSQLWIAGEGPLKTKLMELVDNLKLNNKVEFLGTVPHSEIPRLLNRAHLFVRPSRAEGFGVSFVEAMACGVPVVTCPSGGILDFVKNGETGMLVPQDDPEALFRAMERLILSPKDYAHISETALKLVKDHYAWSSIVEKVDKRYRELAEL